MIHEINVTLAISFTSVLLTLSVVFYSLSRHTKIPVFKTIFRIMILTYSFEGLFIVRILSRNYLLQGEDVLIFQIIALISSMLQILLFTFVHILLINPAYVAHKRMVCKLVLIIILSIISVFLDFVLPVSWIEIITGLLFPFYIYLLILFIITYRDSLRKVDNFFSDAEAKQLHRINHSFYVALSIGALALALSLFPTVYFALLPICCLFYIYFACRLINYGNIYKKIEIALDDKLQPAENQNILQTSGNSIESKLKVWVEEKRFLQSGITIDDLTFQFGTNRSYLSEYINNVIGKTFRQWINELRIEEAKTLMQQYPEMTLNEIALQVGYSDKSNFIRQFIKQIGSSPNTWKINS